METLDVRLSSSSKSKESSYESGADETEGESRGRGIDEGGADIRYWSSLVQSKELVFDGDRQSVGLEEALWMTEHWKNLEYIEGAFRGVGGGNVDKLKTLFAEKDVIYYDNVLSVNKIHLLIGKHLQSKTLYSLIRSCHALYSYMLCLWIDVTVHIEDSTIDAAYLRTNTHPVEAVTYSPSLTEEYHTIVFPRLHTLRLDDSYRDDEKPHHLQVQRVQRIQFIQNHPYIKILSYQYEDFLPREF
ncbi:hypothetical protein BG015_011388 [Linnemannia schmuckeri]|uniref:Uncharacterized protein n=1 Tax=Linnemannia schmuckeri TaxID=64567 RepID=A0A9P5RT46_9FUNG|nr:hypothetical protein BG015_011388 [Linnemannia schmuckeri]